MSPRKKIARRSLGALSCLQPKWACAWPSRASWHHGQWPILLLALAG
jgi:hypothetical protein